MLPISNDDICLVSYDENHIGNTQFIKTQTMKISFTLVLLLISLTIRAQMVGINTVDPTSTLEIKATNASNPSITEGFTVPRVLKLAQNPTANQDGMIVYLTNDWIDTSVTPSIIYSSGLYTWDWNYSSNSGIWIRFLASKPTTKPTTVFRSLSSAKVAIGDVAGSSRPNNTVFPASIGSDNILNATLVRTVSQTEYFKIQMVNPLESNSYLTIVTLESKGIEADLTSNNSTILNDSDCFIPGTADYKNGSFVVGVRCSGGTNDLVLNILVFDLYKGD